MFLPQAMPNQQNQQSCGDQIKAWWQSVPFFNKFIISLCTLLFIVNLVYGGGLYNALSDKPSKTLENFQLWRTFTAWMIHRDILDLLFCAISFFPESLRLEKVCGTTAFIFDFLMKNLEIQFVFLLLSTILRFIYFPLSNLTSSGLWDMVMLFITIRSASNPEQPTPFLCFPVVIKSKYYPFLIIILFSFLSQAPVSLISALLVGYLETYFFNGMLIRISRSKAMWIEDKLFSYFKGRPDFISAQVLDSPYFNQERNYGGNIQAVNAPPASNNSNLNVMGGRGVSIGSGPSNVNNNINTSVSSLSSSKHEEIKKIEKKESFGGDKNVFTGKGVAIGGVTIDSKK